MPIKFDRLQTIVLYRNFPPDNTTACIKQDKINSTNQVNLKKNFGFSIVGGSNSPIGDIGIFVKTVSPGGLAATSNLLKQGDEIVAVNGKSLHGLTHAEAIKVLKKCGRYSLILTLSHKIQNQALISCIDDEFHSSQIQISENVQQPTFKLNSTTMKKNAHFCQNQSLDKTNKIQSSGLTYKTHQARKNKLSTKKVETTTTTPKRYLPLIQKVLIKKSNRVMECNQRVVCLTRNSYSERLGLGVAIESDQIDERVLCVTVDEVDEASISFVKGIKAGDRIWAINGVNVHDCRRVQCLTLFQKAPLSLSLILSSPYKSGCDTYDLYKLDDTSKSYRHNNNLHNLDIPSKERTVEEHEYETIRPVSPNFPKLTLQLAHIPQYLNEPYCEETFSETTLKPPPLTMNKSKCVTINNCTNKDGLSNVTEPSTPFSFDKRVMSISSDHSSTTPDYHSPTHSEDSGFHNDNFNQALRTTVKATTNFAGQQQSKLLTSTTNRYKNISADTKSDMISEKADCYFKSRNCPSSIYGYMDCKMSKSSTTFLNKITIGPSKPIVPPKPKFFSQDNDANCLKSHRLFNRASEQNNLNETCKEDQLPCAEQLQSKPFATVSSLIQQFQSGNIHHHDDEETDYTKNNLDMFQTNAPSIEEVTIIDDYFVLKKSNSEQNNNNKEDQFYPTSDNRYKELVEKYREPSPLQSTISPALRSLIEKDRANISQEEKKTSKSSFPETKGSFIEIDSNVLTEDDLESFAEIEFGVETVPENETIYSVPIQKIESFQMPVMPDRLAKAEKRDFEKEITKDSSRINFDQNLIRKDSQMLHLIREDANKLNLIREDANKLNLIREDANKFNLIREDANKLNLIREDANKLNLDLIEEDSIEQNLDFSQQLITIKKLLQDKFEDYDIYNISMQRVANIIDGSVGIILTGAESTTSHSVITVQKVITGSVADREGTLAKGDSLFYIQGQSTSKMSAADARSALKAPAQVVSVVAGRFNSLKRFKMENQYNSINDTFAKDPNTCVYSNSIESVVLKKTAIGVGLSIDGGSDSLLGIRPIFVKRLFLGGEASKSNLISVGDIITSIETMSFQSITYLEAWKYLKTLPEGPITINIKKLQK